MSGVLGIVLPPTWLTLHTHPLARQVGVFLPIPAEALFRRYCAIHPSGEAGLLLTETFAKEEKFRNRQSK